jgi:leader peptidase (prepilin peptidase)/N-methyltransferase
MRLCSARVRDLPPVVFQSYLFVLGALVGSFLNVVIARLPEGLSVVRPRSRCPKCGDMIPWYLNIPVLSWLLLRGRCRACKTPISIRYPVVELLTALLFLAVAVKYGMSLATLSGILLCGGLVAVTFIDLDIWEIPDEISLPGIVIGVILRPLAFDVPWYDGLVGAAIGAGFLWLIRWGFYVLRGFEGMGFGDVKLIGMIGAFVGPLGLLPTVLVASVSGTVIGGISLLVARARGGDEAAPPPDPVETPASPEPEATTATPAGEEDEEDWTPPPGAVPFGPFLSMGAIAAALIGDQLLPVLTQLGR